MNGMPIRSFEDLVAGERLAMDQQAQQERDARQARLDAHLLAQSEAVRAAATPSQPNERDWLRAEARAVRNAAEDAGLTRDARMAPAGLRSVGWLVRVSLHTENMPSYPYDYEQRYVNGLVLTDGGRLRQTERIPFRRHDSDTDSGLRNVIKWRGWGLADIQSDASVSEWRRSLARFTVVNRLQVGRISLGGYSVE
jgi:hypothetical protein